MRTYKSIVAGKSVYFQTGTWFDARAMAQIAFNQQPDSHWNEMVEVEDKDLEHGAPFFVRDRSGSVVSKKVIRVIEVPPLPALLPAAVKSVKKAHRNGR